MEIKLKSGLKLKLKDISIDERDEMLDSLSYEYEDGNLVGVKMMNATITKWLRNGLDGDTSDKFLKSMTMEDRVEAFTKMQDSLLLGKETASK